MRDLVKGDMDLMGEAEFCVNQSCSMTHRWRFGDASKTLLILATRNVEQAEKVTSEVKKELSQTMVNGDREIEMTLEK